MAAADARAIEAGSPPLVLMDRAASAVVRVIRGRFAPRPLHVVCGPGQNGGDGWAAAWMLGDAGWPVTLYSDTPPDRLTDAAAQAAVRSGRTAEPLERFGPGEDALIIDALFGAGLSRPLEGTALAAVRAMNAAHCPVVAIDLPSGVDGATGRVMGDAPAADATVTFHRAKPGHLLRPGASLVGEVFLADIGLDPSPEGIAHADARRAGLKTFRLPRPSATTHKYARGSVVVASGGHASGGAARLAAKAAARAGAGAVSIASPLSAVDVHARACDAIMVRPVREPTDLAVVVAERNSVAVLGPGMGRSDRTRTAVLNVLNLQSPCVVDADALTMFEADPDTLFSLLHPACVLTPHEGEFARLFGESPSGDGKIARTQRAADRAGCAVLLKGPDTVVAAPGQVPVICDHGPPWLATAGSGDTLCGIIAAFMAQGVDAMEAAGAGAWLHAEAGHLGGPALVADDLAELVGRAYATGV